MTKENESFFFFYIFHISINVIKSLLIEEAKLNVFQELTMIRNE